MKQKLIAGVVALVVTVVAAFLFMDFVRSLHRRSDAAQHLRFIIQELYIYDDIYGRIPHAIERNDAGEAMHSWRFATCRILFGSTGFYGEDASSARTEPWNSPKNKRYFDGPHLGYGGSPTSFIDPARKGDFTRFVAITGPDTAFDGQKDVKLSDMPGDLIIIVETRNSTQHWMEPGGDFDVRTMPREINPSTGEGISGHDPDGFLVGFASGEVWFLSNGVPFNVLSQFFTISEAKIISKAELLATYRIDL